MAIFRFLIHLQMTCGIIITEEPVILYGIPALLALFLCIVVLRLVLSHKRKRKVACHVEEAEAAVPVTASEETVTQPLSQPAPVCESEPQPEKPMCEPLPERDPVPMPDIVGGENAVVDICPTDAIERDGKLCMYFDLQVRID